MRPHVVVHNTVSLDGSIDGFEIDLYLHYGLVPALGTDATLVGSKTSRTGIELFGELTEETAEDRRRPDDPARQDKPLWFVPDSGGILQGYLHALRRSEFCRDVVVFASRRTPAAYLEYLRERDYDHHVLGEERVDLAAALELIGDRYGARRVLVDSGPELVGALFARGLVDQLSLAVAPAIAGAGGRRLFGGLGSPVPLTLVRQGEQQGHVTLLYDVERGASAARA